MVKWLLIGGAGAVVGYVAVYFALDVKPAPEPPAEQPAVVSAPAEPVLLAAVVDVTNLDPLLEPRLEPPAGVPFDPTEPLEPRVPTDEPELIPPAAEEFEEPAAEVAPAPREARTRPALDAFRVSWYGDQVMHRQLYDWLFAPRTDGTLGIGFFF